MKEEFLAEITADGKILNEKLQRSAEWAKLTPEELKEKGVYGEVSHIEFWSWEKLYLAFTSQSENKLASGTISSLANREIREKIYKKCMELRLNCRKKFANEFPYTSYRF